MKPTTFALQGIGGVYNYGCEAIVRGTVKALRETWPQCTILYSTPRMKEDAEVLADLDLKLVNDRVRVPSVTRLINKVFRLSQLPMRLSVKDYFDWMREVDVVLSVGGDLFTLAPGDEKRRDFPLAEHVRYMQRSGKPVVLWGASIGPFDANPRAVKVFAGVFRQMRLISVREKHAEAYLEKLGVTSNVRRAADPAFVMDADASHAEEDRLLLPEEPVLGLNLSPLSTRFASYEEGRSGIPETHASFLRRLLEETSHNIALVPHVISPWSPADDDHGYLAGMLASLPTGLRDRVRLLPGTLGARRTKWLISQCEALVSARMHCAIAGMSSGVPTLLLSYSEKAKGMCDYVYGDERWVMPVSSGVDELMKGVADLFTEADSLRACLAGRRDEFRRSALDAGRLLKEALDR